jgi:hypothetical protein
VPVFLERFILAVLVTFFMAAIVFNAMNFDHTQRFTLGIAIVMFAYFVGHTIHKSRQSPTAADATAPLSRASVQPESQNRLERPRFSPIKWGIEMVKDPENPTNSYPMRALSFSNAGKHAASGIRWFLLIAEQSLDKAPTVLEKKVLANERGPGESMTISYPLRKTENPAEYIYFRVDFEDAETKQPFHQEWYLAWSRSDATGKTMAVFSDVDATQKAAIQRFLGANGI